MGAVRSDALMGGIFKTLGIPLQFVTASPSLPTLIVSKNRSSSSALNIVLMDSNTIDPRLLDASIDYNVLHNLSQEWSTDEQMMDLGLPATQSNQTHTLVISEDADLPAISSPYAASRSIAQQDNVVAAVPRSVYDNVDPFTLQTHVPLYTPFSPSLSAVATTDHIELSPTKPRYEVLHAESDFHRRKRKKDPSRKDKRGPNTFGRKGTRRCVACRKWKQRVQL